MLLIDTNTLCSVTLIILKQQHGLGLCHQNRNIIYSGYFTHVIFSESKEVFLGILHIVIKTSDDHGATGFVLGKADVHPVTLHHLGDGLPTSSNQTTVHAVVNVDLICYLFLLRVGRGKKGGGKKEVGKQ